MSEYDDDFESASDSIKQQPLSSQNTSISEINYTFKQIQVNPQNELSKNMQLLKIKDIVKPDNSDLSTTSNTDQQKQLHSNQRFVDQTYRPYYQQELSLKGNQTKTAFRMNQRQVSPFQMFKIQYLNDTIKLQQVGDKKNNLQNSLIKLQNTQLYNRQPTQKLINNQQLNSSLQQMNQQEKKNQSDKKIKNNQNNQKFFNPISNKVIVQKSPFGLKFILQLYLIRVNKSTLENSRFKPSKQINDFKRPVSLKPIPDLPNSLTSVSAKCWAVFDRETGEFIGGKNEHMKREVASITKIMTCWVSIQLASILKINMIETYFEVSLNAELVGGTTANLTEGDQVCVKDLLYGLMLPSGNDAAVTLAENFGEYEAEMSEYHQETTNYWISEDGRMDFFVSQMNRWAKQFQMNSTCYTNPHGLIDERNKSSAYDIGKLTIQCLQNEMIRRIISTKLYFCEMLDENGNIKELFWENTNKLLYKGFSGVKTGITNRAGPCVVEWYKDDEYSFVIIVLSSKSSEERWNDIQKLLNWAKMQKQ